MPGESEYRRVFRSPDELQTHSPNETSTIIAGVSSVKLGITQEPALPRKKKVPDHDRKVTFTTHHGISGDPPAEEDAGMHFRAGFRRSNRMTPTEYQLQYTWKALKDGSPLLNAESSLRHRQEEPRWQKQPTPEELLEDPQNNPQGWRGMRSLGGGHLLEEDKRNQGLGTPNYEESVDEEPPRSKPPRTLVHPPISSSQPRRHHKGSSRKKHHHHHKKHHQHRSGLISEYHAQFKPWPIERSGKDDAGGTDADSKPLPGAPRLLDDPTDPRLLKHSPLPLAGDPPPQPSIQWGSEYSSNFGSPTKYKFVHGAWQGAPHPDLFYQPPLKNGGVREKASREREEEREGEEEDPKVEPENESESNSWYQQVVDLHQKAEDYKRRAQGTHFSRELLLQLEDKQRRLFERASSVCSCSTTSSTSGSRIVSDSLSPVSEEGSEPEGRGREGDILVKDIEDEEAGVGGFPLRPGPRHSRPRFTEFRRPHSNGYDVIDVKSSPPASDHHSGDERLERSSDELKAPSYQGRVPTPELKDGITKSTTRHHLDLTTPVDGGVLTSPVKLPYPPLSPKYRRDMRSIAPIFPSPKVPERAPTKPDTQGGNKGPKQKSPLANPEERAGLPPHSTGNRRHGTSTHHGLHPALPSSQPGSLRRSPKVTHTSEGGAVRQLRFDSRRTHAGDRGLKANKGLCDTYGSVLRSLPPPSNRLSTRYNARTKLHSMTLPAKTTPLTSGGSGRPNPMMAATRLPGNHRPVHRMTTHSTPEDPLLTHPHPFPLSSSPVPERDVDLHSLSSCSVASDLLRRAQERRDYFWTRPLET